MFLQNSPKTAHKNLTIMALGAMYVVPENPFSVMLSTFGHRAVHIPKHTVVGLPLPSPTHILTVGQSAASAAEAKEGGIFNSNPSTAEDAAGEAADNRTDKGGAEQATPPRAPLGADGRDKPEDTAAPEDNPNAWRENVHIGAEDEEVRSEVLEVLSEFKGMWAGRLGKSVPRNTASSSSPVLVGHCTLRRDSCPTRPEIAHTAATCTTGTRGLPCPPAGPHRWTRVIQPQPVRAYRGF